MKKINLLLIPLIATIFLLAPVLVSATNVDTSRTEGISSRTTSNASVDAAVQNGKNQVYENTSDDVFDDEVIKKVSTEEVGNRITNKIYELISILQKIAKPVSIFMFIISGFVALLGIFAHGGYVMKGIWGMIIAIVIYTVIVVAPEIVVSLSGWLMS